MKSEKTKSELTPLQRLIVNEPTQRFILWVIANDSEAFSIKFNIEILKRQELLIPDKAPHLAKALVIYQNLLTKRMVDARNPLRTKITWRGNFYRFYTHPFFIPCCTIIGIIIAVITVIFTHSKQRSDIDKKEQVTIPQIKPVVSDSIPYRKKKDSAKQIIYDTSKKVPKQKNN